MMRVPNSSERREIARTVASLAAIVAVASASPSLARSSDGPQAQTQAEDRKLANKAIAFEGKISVGGNTSLVSSPDNTDIGEKEFLQT